MGGAAGWQDGRWRVATVSTGCGVQTKHKLDPGLLCEVDNLHAHNCKAPLQPGQPTKIERSHEAHARTCCHRLILRMKASESQTRASVPELFMTFAQEPAGMS